MSATPAPYDPKLPGRLAAQRVNAEAAARRATQVRNAVAAGHHTSSALATAIGLSVRRARELMAKVPGLLRHAARLPGHGPRPVVYVTLPGQPLPTLEHLAAGHDADDEPWTPQEWVHPYRAARGAA